MRNVTKAELDEAIRAASAGDTLHRPMHYSGNLDLRYRADITHLPEGLSVGSNLDLTGCTSLTHLPDGLSVDGDLYLSGCTSLTHLPDGLSVGSSLYLSGCTGLMEKNIPAHLRSKAI